jgi:hypothetical protein
VGECRNKNTQAKCPGKYILSYEDNAPIFTCEKCGDRNLTWSKFYKEYLQLFRVKENWDNKKHQVSCIIGFFCHMYEEFYDTPYVFVPKNPNPFGSKECRDTWALLSAFNGNAHSVRKYIYWFFKHGLSKNSNIISFAYINTPALIRKYMLHVKKKNILTRASKLPTAFVDWCREFAPSIFDSYALETMNDLGALLSYVQYYGSEVGDVEAQTIQRASELGLIKNGKINIGVQNEENNR